MLFSIIIPIYKVEKYLRECIDSVLSQSFSDFEVILVDDGSPDDCPRICDEYERKDNHVKVLHQVNAGQASARNVAISVAQGDYIICLDGDDRFADSSVLKAICENVADTPDVLIYGYKKLFEINGLYGIDVVPKFESGINKEDVLFAQLKDDSYGGQAWTKAVKTSLLRENKIQFRIGMVGEDTDWYLKVLMCAKSFGCLSKPCVIYRQRADSTSHAPKITALTDFLWILEHWTQKLEKEDLLPQMYNALMSVLAYYYPNLLIIYSCFKKDYSLAYKNRIKKLSTIQRYSVSSRARKVKMFYNLFGFDITVLLLKLLSRLRTNH